MIYWLYHSSEMKVKFIRPLENSVSLRGGGLTLRCEINKPKGDVQWLKDGKEIPPGRRHVIRAHGRERSLTIHVVAEEDAGEYTCESTDDRTSATVAVEGEHVSKLYGMSDGQEEMKLTCCARLSAPRVVEFIAELRNITVREGEDAAFKCVVSPEDTQLVWRLNDKTVVQSEHTVVSSTGLCHTLCIRNCTVSDGGKVTADAEGLLSEAELQVQGQMFVTTSLVHACVIDTLRHGLGEYPLVIGWQPCVKTM